MEETRNKLKEILQQVLDQEIDQLIDDMTADDFPDWDSLAHLNIVVSVEKAFNIRFAAAEISKLKRPGQNIGTFLGLIAQKAPPRIGPSMEEIRNSLDPGQAVRFWRRILAAVLLIGPGGAILLNKGWLWIGSAGHEGARPGWGFGWVELLVGRVVALPLLALAGFWVQRIAGPRTRGVLIFAATVACVLAAEVGLRNRSIQSHFWTAVISRLDAPDWGLIEPAMLHYENLKAKDGEEIPGGVAIFGSSQGAVNFDREFMARELRRPVIRRALNGMFAFEMCAAQPMLAVPRAQTAIFYLSPLDLAANIDVRANWMRSLISPRSWMDLVAVLGPRLAWENKQPLSELAAASVLHLWAFRDGARWILFNLAGRTPDPAPRDSSDKVPAPSVQPLKVKPDYVEASFADIAIFSNGFGTWATTSWCFRGRSILSCVGRSPTPIGNRWKHACAHFLKPTGLRMCCVTVSACWRPKTGRTTRI